MAPGNKVLIHSFLPPILTECLFSAPYCASTGDTGLHCAFRLQLPQGLGEEVGVSVGFLRGVGPGAGKRGLEIRERVGVTVSEGTI